MNPRIEQRITTSLAALRSRWTASECDAARAVARTWSGDPRRNVPAFLQLAATLLRQRPVTRSFIAVSNTRRLANGAAPYAALARAAAVLHDATRHPGNMPELPEFLREHLLKAAQLVGVAAWEANLESALERGATGTARAWLHAAMRACPQGYTQSTAEHCASVAGHYRVLQMRLTWHPTVAARYRTWRQHLPAWFEQHAEALASALRGHEALAREYLLWHDCAKPLCLEFDADGKTHFPDHAARSEQLWLRLGGSSQAAHLMAHDMDLHTLAPAAMPQFAEHPHAVVLLVAALAAINANAAMFGGFESDSFKIKAKQLQARGKRLCAALFERVSAG